MAVLEEYAVGKRALFNALKTRQTKTNLATKEEANTADAIFDAQNTS